MDTFTIAIIVTVALVVIFFFVFRSMKGMNRKPQSDDAHHAHNTGTASAQGNNQEQQTGTSLGTMNRSNQSIQNHAPNQGAQGSFHAPVHFDQRQTSFDQRGLQVQGDQYNAARDLIQAGGDVAQVGGDYVGGDQIDAQGAQGFINRPTGPVHQQFGDTVSGDTISGDITTGNVSGSGIAIGHSARAQAQVQQSGDADAFARAFAQVYQAINDRSLDPDVDKDEIRKTVQAIQEEAQKGDQASEKRLTRWLHHLAAMAEDIFAVTIAALTGPQAAFATVARKVAAKAQQQREQQ